MQKIIIGFTLLFWLVSCKNEPIPPTKTQTPNSGYLGRNYTEFWEDSCKFLKIYKKPHNDFDFRVEHAWDCPAKKHKIKQ